MMFLAMLPGLEPAKPAIVVVANKWFDARTFATRYFGGVDVDVSAVDAEQSTPPQFWELRWQGNAGGSNPLHLEARLVTRENEEPKWKHLREI